MDGINWFGREREDMENKYFLASMLSASSGVRAATKVFRSGEVEFDSTNSCPETNHSDAATFS